MFAGQTDIQACTDWTKLDTDALFDTEHENYTQNHTQSKVQLSFDNLHSFRLYGQIYVQLLCVPYLITMCDIQVIL